MTDASRQSSHRTLSPWVLIGGVALLAVVATVILGIVGALLLPLPGPVPTGLAQAELADGSILVVHGLTEGSSQLELPEPATAWWKRLLGLSQGQITFHGNSYGNNPLYFWLARYDGETGAPLEFDDWSCSILRTPAGSRVWDSPYAQRVTRSTHPHTSTSSSSNSRPFSERNELEPKRYSHILYCSNFPRVRSATGEVEIDIVHIAEGRIATLTLPLPGGATSAPVWTPQPLPVTQSDGDVAVTLTGLTSQRHTDESQPHARPRLQVRCETTVSQRGEESALWPDRRIQLLDVLGNVSSPYDVQLSPDESAWKVRMDLDRPDETVLVEGLPQLRAAAGAPITERLVAEDIPLPDTDPATLPNATPLSETATIDGVTITLLGAGGPGPCEYRCATTHGSRGTHSTGAGIETRFEPPRATVSIDNRNGQRHVALTVEGQTPQNRVGLLLSDQSGLLLDTGREHSMGDVRVWTFDADELARAVNVYVVVQRARTVEFLVTPPANIQSDAGR